PGACGGAALGSPGGDRRAPRAAAGGAGDPPSRRLGGTDERAARDRARLLGERGDDPAPSRPQAPRGTARERRARGRTFGYRMNENDAMTRLAQANPVQTEDLMPLAAPDRFARRQ